MSQKKESVHCSCGAKIAEKTVEKVEIKCKKCKEVSTIIIQKNTK